ncbi:MAG: DUF1464 family protein, partial [Candidatus Bathyarchaeia archaeon]
MNPKDVQVLGLDAGTGSWDIVSFVDDEVRVEFSMPTVKVVANPHIIVRTLLRFRDYDLIPLPLGYGFPVTKVQKLTDENIKQITLHPSIHEKPDFETVLRELRRTNLNAVTIPSVKHLPTVPSWRKINRIDLGTPDKVCVAAWAIRAQANRRGIPFERTSFILVEVGLGFTAVLGVQNGCIVDGVGGTMGPMGLRSMGDLDGEVAALMRSIDKAKVYGSGASTILNRPLGGLSELLQAAES